MALLQTLGTIPESLTGGKIISIILRQIILKTNLRLFDADSNPVIYAFGMVPVTSRKQEVYEYPVDVTEHAVEDGTIYSDHIILRPVKVTMDFEISNLLPDMVKYAFQMLVSIRNQRAPIDLLTENGEIKNVIITSLTVLNKAPNWNALEISASFQQLSFVNLTTVDFPTERVEYPAVVEGQTRPSEPDVSKSAESKTISGWKIPKIPTVSTLAGLFD